MQIRIHYHDKSSETIDSSPQDKQSSRDKISSLLRRQGCHWLAFLDVTGKVILSLKGSN